LADKISDFIFSLFVLIPLYGVLLWIYFCPEESALWGRRWMYKEEPEVTEGAIRYAKIASVISMVVLTLILILFFLT
jgi:uncharacterized BrkB/YihY/UPF0761 family membrane protein